MSNAKFLIISESTYGENVSSEPVSLWSTYNGALQELTAIAREFGRDLDDDDDSFVIGTGTDLVEYYVTSMIEDES